MNKWISVKDKKPRLKKKVLVYIPCIDGYASGWLLSGGYWLILGEANFDTEDVTHWKEIEHE